MQGIEVGSAKSEVQAEGRHLPRRLVRRQARPAVRPAREDPAREAGLPRSGDPHLRRCVVDDGDDEPDGRQGDRRQGGARRRRDAGQRRRQARRHRDRHRAAVRGRALRLEQHDHAALPPEGSEGAGGREGVQARRRHVPGRIVHRERRRRQGSAGRRSARADGGRPRGGAATCRCTISICRASRSTAPGAARRTSAGCASRSTSSSCPTT